MSFSELQVQKVLSLLGFAARSGKIAFGKDMLRDYITNPKLKRKVVLIATDAGERVKRDLKIRCEINRVPYFEFSNKSELARAVGKREISAIGVMEPNIVDGILDVLQNPQNERT
ncbi:L7Ae/L30e/S12e/Gadd45 family ribosomal protein [Fervidobacterium thailandense]|uniref:50S ribosomal protein L7ae n=1 Tax=Fervidobacterium thailandense TaxID=1008305 RepID=A0A1E3G4V5_9BACT|nr:ribosomal L7Ae/L30e/S12e/Gadd45 family protein [Fervidobacterium thailandense]ODN31212.1 50S ribosomal protein L7ae [Fervidobacterium thailandense]